MKKFMEDTFQRVDANRCPFLQKTIGRKVDTILSAPPRGLGEEALRMWRNKVFYAFCMVINPRFNRKQFASAFGVAYGTARNWKNDQGVIDLAAKIASDFAESYLGEVKRLLSLPRGKMRLAEYLKQRNDTLHTLFAEAAFYKNDFLFTLLTKMMTEFFEEQNAVVQKEFHQDKAFLDGKIKRPANIEGADFATLAVRAVELFFHILKVFHGFYENAEELDAYDKNVQDTWELYFLALSVAIKDGKTQHALDYVEVLQQEVKQLLKGTLFLEKELLKVRFRSEKQQDS